MKELELQAVLQLQSDLVKQISRLISVDLWTKCAEGTGAPAVMRSDNDGEQGDESTEQCPASAILREYGCDTSKTRFRDVFDDDLSEREYSQCS